MFSTNKASSSITDMIRDDHAQMLETFHEYTISSRASARKLLAESICAALDIHTMLEEEIFYPIMRRLDPGGAVIQKSEPEHDEMQRMIAQLRATDAADEQHDTLLHELMRDLMHHVADEETILLPEAERLLGKERLDELGAAMARRRLGLLKPQERWMTRVSGGATAIMVGLASALVAARLVSKKRPETKIQPH